MEIRIDTKKDSVDDIKKVIRFLQHFVDENPSGYESDYGGMEADEGMFNIFGDDSEEEAEDTRDVFGNTFSEPEDDDDDDDVTITPYS